jgi:hypothetical protein
MSMSFYNSIDQCYTKVLTLDRMPCDDSPLHTLTKKIQLPKLSPFKQTTCCEPIQTCGIVLLCPNDLTQYASIHDIPLVFSWLTQNNFTIDTSITNMLNQSDVNMKNPIVCFITQKN